MKRLSLFVAIALSLTSTSGYAATTIKGTPCKKAGSSKTIKGFKYTCLKAGGKLSWSSGKRVPIGITSTPTPTPAPTATFSPWDAETNADVLHAVAFENFSKWMELQKTNNQSKLVISIDPALRSIDLGWISKSATLASEVLGNYAPNIVTLYVAGQCTWIIQKGFPCSPSLGNKYYSDAIASGFIVLDTVTEVDRLRPSDFQTPAHEYFHVVQGHLLQNRETKTAPLWLIEGSSMFVGAAFSQVIGSSTISANVREALPRYWNQKPRPLSDYSYENQSAVGHQEINPYGIGLLAVEYIVASTGVRELLMVFQKMGSGLSFERAFEESIGLSVDKFYSSFETVRQSLGLP